MTSIVRLDTPRRRTRRHPMRVQRPDTTTLVQVACILAEAAWLALLIYLTRAVL